MTGGDDPDRREDPSDAAPFEDRTGGEPKSPDIADHVTTLTGTCPVCVDVRTERDPGKGSGSDVPAWDEEGGRGDAGREGDSPRPDADGSGTWSCPRGGFGPYDRCLFHVSASERKAVGVDEPTVTDALLTAATAPGSRVKEVVGGRFEQLDLSHRRVEANDNFPVDLREATVESVVIEDATLRQSLRFEDATIGSVRIAWSRVEGRLAFDRTTVRGDVELEKRFEAPPSFSNATVEGSFTARPAVFDYGILCEGCTFRGEVDFYADFNDEPEFGGSTFEGDAEFFVDINADSYFDNVTFAEDVEVFADINGDSYFTDATFEGSAVFRAAFNGTIRFNRASFEGPLEVYGRFNSDAHFPGASFGERAAFVRRGEESDSARFYRAANFREAAFRGPAVFENVEFHGRADFTRATFEETARFDDAWFERQLEFEDVSVDGGATFVDAVLTGRCRIAPSRGERPRRIDLHGATLSTGRISVPGDRTVFDLTRATIGDVALEGGSDRLFDHFVVAATTFDGFDFSAHQDELARRNWTVHETVGEDADPFPPALLEETYLKAKQGAKASGESDAASNFFRRELAARRRRHRAGAAAATNPLVTLRAVGNYTANLMLDVSCGYGEKPWRVVASSGGIIVLFAAIFAGLDVGVAYTTHPVSHLILSTETFVSLVLGAPAIRDPVVNLVTSIEAFLGAFFIALFVFALTRSIRR